MALTKYTYSKDANISVLADEVLADAGITTALDHIDLIDDADPDTVDVWFVDAISGAEQTALDAVVAAHTNPVVPTADHVHAGLGAPDNQLGANGDVCLDPDTLTIYKKAAGAWDAGKSIDGTPPLDDLSDVVFTTPAAGEVLKFDGTDWINNTLAEAGVAAASHTHVEADITDLQAYIADITGESLEDLSDVTFGVVVDGEVLRYNGSIWINNTLVEAGIAAASHTHVEADITDLQSYLTNLTGEDLGNLGDVTLTGIGPDELLKWDGAKWINNTLAQAGIEVVGHTHVEADITDLQAYLLDITGESLEDLSDVTFGTVADGELIRYNGTNWINNTLAEAGISAVGHTHLEADITDLQPYLVYADFDIQQQGANTTSNTTSTSYVTPSFMTLTTSNTRNLNYQVIANFEVTVSLAATTATFELVENGTGIANSERSIILDATESPTVVTLIGYVANVADALDIEVQMKTDQGTLTMGNRSIIIRGIA